MPRVVGQGSRRNLARMERNVRDGGGSPKNNKSADTSRHEDSVSLENGRSSRRLRCNFSAAEKTPPEKVKRTRKNPPRNSRSIVMNYDSEESEKAESSEESDSKEEADADEEVIAAEDEDDEAEEDEEDKESNVASSCRSSSRGSNRRNGNSTSNGASSKLKDPRAAYYFVKDLNIKELRYKEELCRFRYLLGLGDIFLQFVDYRAQRDESFRKLLDQARRDNSKVARATAKGPRKSRNLRSKGDTSEMSEITDLMPQGEEDEKITVFSESPGFIKGTLRQYQIDGLNWLVSLYINQINGILADEMGLGKTFQCISFLAYLRHIQNVSGPHLVIIPKSTVHNWAREFDKWTPDVDVLVLTGTKEERADLIQNRLLTCKFDICICSFELVIREKAALQKIAWEYVIVDEAHRIKNEESILSKIMRVFFSRHRLLITGTPLQNNLHELWALLNFLLPDVFSDADVFDEWFSQREREVEEEEEEEDGVAVVAADGDDTNLEKKKSDNAQNQVIEQLRQLLSPFLLRRVKHDVEHTLLPKKEINLYANMTDMQLEWYQRLLLKDLDAVNNTNKAGRDGKMRLLNVVMQLRKCCNHPYLFEGAEPGPPFTTDEHLVNNSSKMLILDKLLKHLKKQGSRVLIFSQMGRMLDILEDFCALREYEYCRIDGSTAHQDRVNAIDEFNKPNSSKFLFLLTTRAGGLGINLTSADQVVIYDSDWNPQADLQAMDRAHRIGQTKQVWVYRLIVENAIEEKILERAAHKLRLDQLVIQGNSVKNIAENAANPKEELANMIRHGAQDVIDQNKITTTNVRDINIEDIIAAGEKRTKMLNQKYSDLGFDELQRFTFDKPPSNQAPITANNVQKFQLEDEFRHHHRRARNHAMYTDEVVIQDIDKEGGKSTKSSTVRAPKQLVLHDFQFFPQELEELQARELAWYRKVAGIRLSPEDYSSDEEDESDDRNAEIEGARPFTEEDHERKEELIKQGFPTFTKRDFYHFINSLSKFGNAKSLSDEALDEVCENWPEKPADEIKRYYKVFFERYTEIQDYERYMNQLQAGEKLAQKHTHRLDLLRKRIESVHNPLSNMVVTQPTGGSASRYRFSKSNDRFILTELHKLGPETPEVFEKIYDRIRICGFFDFDFYFMSRTSTDIARRCTSLLNIIAKESDGATLPKGSKRKGRPPTQSKESSKRVKENVMYFEGTSV